MSHSTILHEYEVYGAIFVECFVKIITNNDDTTRRRIIEAHKPMRFLFTMQVFFDDFLCENTEKHSNNIRYRESGQLVKICNVQQHDNQ